MHTEVKHELKQRVAQSAYCVDPRQIATAIIVRLATTDGRFALAGRGSGPIPSESGGPSRRTG